MGQNRRPIPTLTRAKTTPNRADTTSNRAKRRRIPVSFFPFFDTFIPEKTEKISRIPRISRIIFSFLIFAGFPLIDILRYLTDTVVILQS